MTSKWEKMSDEELKEQAKQRNKRTGCFKNTAISAQVELWKRYHWGVQDSYLLDDETIDRTIEDIQYNG